MSNGQIIFEFAKNPRFDIGDFIEDATNKEALELLFRWPNWPNKIVNIYGEYKCGKTHLSNLWMNYVNAKKILKQDLSSPARDLLEDNCNFLIDSAEELLSDIEYEKWIFDFINISTEKQSSVLIISRTANFNSFVSLNDLSSRLNAVYHVKITQPEDDLLKKITFKLSSDLGIYLEPHVIDYIISRVNRDIDTIYDVICDLDNLSMQEKRKITINMVRHLFKV